MQVAGNLLINVDATSLTAGSLPVITNSGTLGGFFEARGGVNNTPAVARVHGNGTPAIFFDGNDFLQHVVEPGGALVPADASIVGANPTVTIEAWVLNPGIPPEETIVSWGKRGGPNGSNMSFNYGWHDAFGAVGHWGPPDLGWDACCNSGSNPQGVPRSGEWHHLVYTFDGTTQKVFSDGVLKNSENVTLNIHSGTAVNIGAQYEADGVTVTGGARASSYIARLRVHSEALTDAQVLQNYQAEAGQISAGGSPLPFGPVHRYSFNNPAGSAADGTTITDSIGSAHGTVRGAGASLTGTRLTLPGGGSATAAYVDLPNRLLSTNSADHGGSGGITLEGWVKVTGNRNWSRIFDFGSSDVDPTAAFVGGEVTGPGGGGEGLDYLFLSAQEGGNANRRVIDIRNNDPLGGFDPGGPAYDSANANRDFHFAVSWDEPTGNIIVYENGSAVTTMNAGTNRFSSINDVNVWLGRSNWTGDQNMQGEFDEFRIYNRVLPPQQVQASYSAGPNSLATADPVNFTMHPEDRTVPEFGNATFVVSVQGAPPVSLQWYRDGAAMAGQTGTSISLNNAQTSDNGAQFFVIASNFISGMGFMATSEVATLTVIADMTAPTIVQGRLNTSNTVEILFSEPVRATEANEVSNYGITGANAPSILSATLSADGRRVILALSGDLTACEFYEISVSNVRDVSAAGNVIAAGSGVTIWNFATGGMKHRYTFNQPAAANAAGATIPDLVSGADGTVKANGGPTALTGSRLTLGGGSSATAAYVDLPNNLLSNNSTNRGGTGKVTIEGWVKVTGVHNWSRIFDFGSTTLPGGTFGELTGPGGGGEGRDYVFFSAMNGIDPNTRQIDYRNEDPAGGGGVVGPYGTATFNQDFHFVVTWDEATGTFMVYENGVFKTTMVTDDAMSDLNDVNVWLGRSNWTVDGNMQGEFDEFRMYDRLLTPAEIRLNTAGGPDNSFGALLGLDLTVMTNSMVTNTAAPIQVLASFANAGTQNVAAAGCVIYSSSDSNVVFITSGGIIHAVGEGTATVTATLGGRTDSEIIEVTQDAAPPIILYGRANGLRHIEIAFNEPVEQGTAEEPSNYVVTTPSGNIPVESATRLPDETRVLLTLQAPMPCQYITVLLSFVADQSPLFNQVPENTPVSFMNFVQPGMTHRYSFNALPGAASGAVVLDGVGTADGVVLGAGATRTADRLILPGGSSGTAAYVDLPNGLLSTNAESNGGTGEFSIETWVKVTGIHNWARIFDFGSSAGAEVIGPGGGGEGRDYLMVSASIGTDANGRRTELRNEDPGGGGIATIDHTPRPLNEDVHLVLTWDESTGRIRVYENGTQVSTMIVDDRMSDINDVNVWLGRSNWTGDGNMQGEFDEFRLYNRVLTPSQIAFNRTLGPDNGLGQPLAFTLLQTNRVQIGSPLRPQAIVDFTLQSNVNLTATDCVAFHADNQNVIVMDAGGIRAVGLGTANLSATFNGTTITREITVAYHMEFRGLDAGQTYQVQIASEVTGPWQNVGTVTANPEGVGVFEDTAPRGPQAFYRAVLAPVLR